MSTALELAPRPLAGLPPSVVLEFERLVGEVEELIEGSRTESTRERYARQWARFELWCSVRDIKLALPVPVELVQVYLAHWVSCDPIPAWSTIGQARAAIAWVHESNGVVAPDSPKLRSQLKGLRRKLGVAPRRQAAPLRLTHLRAILAEYTRPSRAGLRDALVIALRLRGWTYGEIVGLTTNRLVEVSPLKVTIAMPDGSERIYEGAEDPIVARLNAWLPVRGGFPGPVVVRVSPLDVIEYRGIARQTIPHIVERWSAIAGVEASRSQECSLIGAALAPRPADVRDIATLFLLWTCALRSDELVRLRLRDLRFNEDGLAIYIRFSKTDQEGKGETRVIPRGTGGEIDIVESIRRWVVMLRQAGAPENCPVFVAVDRHDNLILSVVDVENGEEVTVPPCATRAVTDVIRRALTRSLPDLSVELYSSHSGKRGIATELAHSGADVREIMSVTGHKRPETALRYIDEVDRWKTSALRKLSL